MTRTESKSAQYTKPDVPVEDSVGNRKDEANNSSSGRHRKVDVHRVILQLTSSQLITTAITGGLGWLYWATAARLFPSAEVGFTAAAISCMTLIGALANMGTGTLLMGELRRQTDHQLTLLYSVLLIIGVIGLGVGVGGAYLIPLISSNLAPLAISIPAISLFAVGVSLTTVALVLDQALLGLFRGPLQVGRNFVFAAIKLGMLVVVGAYWVLFRQTFGTMTIYATWVTGLVLSMGVLVLIPLLIPRRRHKKQVTTDQGRPAPRTVMLRPRVRQLALTSLSHYALNLGLQVPFFALPVVVASVLSVTSNAYFYSTWVWGSFVFAIPLALAWSLYAVSAANPETLTARVHFTLPLAALVGVVTNLILFPGAHLLLSVYGIQYANHGLWCLRLQGLAVFPLIVKDHFVNIRRVQRRSASAAWRSALGAVLELSGAVLGAHYLGLTGVTIGWLTALVIEAGLAAPLVIRVWQGDSKAVVTTVTALPPVPQFDSQPMWVPGMWLSQEASVRPVIESDWAKAAASKEFMARTTGKLDDTLPASRGPLLELFEEPGSVPSSVLSLESVPVKLGRSSKCEIIVTDPLVSRHHATIYRDAYDQYMLRDEHSSNGTRKNGQYISLGALRDGDELLVGRTRIIFRYDGATASEPES